MGFFKQKAVYYEDDTTSNIEQVLERFVIALWTKNETSF